MGACCASGRSGELHDLEVASDQVNDEAAVSKEKWSAQTKRISATNDRSATFHKSLQCRLGGG